MSSEPEQFGSVLQTWVTLMPWKHQSILLSGLRGPDAHEPQVRSVTRWMRSATQHNADPSKDYMKQTELPDPLKVCSELEYLPCHYVHHFADALAVIAYNHPVEKVAAYAARLHYRIAEEIFHFQPEAPSVFAWRHRDKPDVNDEVERIWSHMQEDAFTSYVDAALAIERGRRR